MDACKLAPDHSPPRKDGTPRGEARDTLADSTTPFGDTPAAAAPPAAAAAASAHGAQRRQRTAVKAGSAEKKQPKKRPRS